MTINLLIVRSLPMLIFWYLRIKYFYKWLM